MGMYTRLVLNVPLKDDGSGFIDTVKRMSMGKADELPGRLSWMFTSSSYYHDNINHSSFVFDDIDKEWKLSVTCDLKNYENEISSFLKLVAPHVTTRHCAGYYLYEGCIIPTLIWFVSGHVVTITPEINEKEFEVTDAKNE